MGDTNLEILEQIKKKHYTHLVVYKIAYGGVVPKHLTPKILSVQQYSGNEFVWYLRHTEREYIYT